MAFVVCESDSYVTSGEAAKIGEDYRKVCSPGVVFIRHKNEVFDTEDAAAAWLVKHKRNDVTLPMDERLASAYRRIDEITTNTERQRQRIAELEADNAKHVKARNELSYDLVSVREAIDAAKRERDEWKAKAEKTSVVIKDLDLWGAEWPGVTELKNKLAASEKRNQKLVADLEAASVKTRSMRDVNEQFIDENHALRNANNMLRARFAELENATAKAREERDEWKSLAAKYGHRNAELEGAAKPAFKVGDRVRWTGFDGLPEIGRIFAIQNYPQTATVECHGHPQPSFATVTLGSSNVELVP